MKERPAAVNRKNFLFFTARSISLTASLASWISSRLALKILLLSEAGAHLGLSASGLRAADSGWFVLIVKELRT